MIKKIIIIACIIILLVGIYWGFSHYKQLKTVLKIYRNNQELVLNDEGTLNSGSFIILEGRIYLNLEWIKEKDLLLYRYSSSKKRILFQIEQSDLAYENIGLQHYLRNSEFELNLPILKREDGEYTDIEPLSRLANFKYVYHSDSGRLVIDTNDFRYYSGRVVKENAVLKINSSLTSLKAENLPIYSAVRIFKETDKAFKIRLSNGFIGYVDKKALDMIEETAQKPAWTVVRAPQFNKYFKIGFIWDYIDGYEENFQKRPVERHNGLDVLSPTWFKLTNEGWVLNDADLGYIQKAHALGYEVWPLFSNDFDPDLTHSMLGSEKLRRKVIAQMIQYAGVYGFRGINIDFENVYLADQGDMTRFMEEFSFECKKMGLVLSIDVTVPWGSDQWSKFADRQSIEPFVDYFMLMAYDEHWASSPIAGSVASLPWVEKGIVESLKLIPKDKLILGIPLYMRIWTENEGAVSSKTLSIVNTDSVLKNQLHLKIWDEETGHFFLSFKEGDVQKKVWIEDEASLDLKLQLIEKYDLAGAAGWRKGFEKSWLWTLFQKILKH